MIKKKKKICAELRMRTRTVGMKLEVIRTTIKILESDVPVDIKRGIVKYLTTSRRLGNLTYLIETKRGCKRKVKERLVRR